MMSDTSTGRLTPYEMVFGVEDLAEQVFPGIAQEEELRGVSTWRYDRFTLFERVAALLEQMLPEEVEPAAVDQHLQILYHCYHFWSAGCPLYAFEAPLLRSLLEEPPKLGDWSFRAPEPSIYIELPKNLFWAQVTEEGPPEPVEGMFVAREPGRPAAEADMLVVLGMRSDRPGFSVAGLRLDTQQARELDRPESFQSEIPGAELAGLYSLRCYSEAATLALRTLWYLDAYPASGARVKGGGGQEAVGGRESTALDYNRVTLIERSRG